MNDDELMDQMLRETMGDEMPQLSAAFDAKVAANVRPRRLNLVGRVVMGAYAIAALAITAWAAQELGVVMMAASILISAIVAFGLGSYARALAPRSA